MSSNLPFPDAPDSPTLRKVQPKELGNLLERNQAIAKSESLAVPPDLWLVDNAYPAAVSYCTSNNVVVTTGLLKILNESEQNAILGHELGHKKLRENIGCEESFAQVIRRSGNYWEVLADKQSVEAAYTSHLYSPDDLSSALTKIRKASMDGLDKAEEAIYDRLPHGVKTTIDSIGDQFNNLFSGLHILDHPTDHQRAEYIHGLEQDHKNRTGIIKRPNGRS